MKSGLDAMPLILLDDLLKDLLEPFQNKKAKKKFEVSKIFLALLILKRL